MDEKRLIEMFYFKNQKYGIICNSKEDVLLLSKFLACNKLRHPTRGISFSIYPKVFTTDGYIFPKNVAEMFDWKLLTLEECGLKNSYLVELL